jgi:DNA-binding HxlR family transcriptional regulator
MPQESKRKKLTYYCPLTGLIDVISRKWALFTIAAIGNHGSLRYNGLLKELEGISPKTLADTLKALQGAGLIKRRSFNEIPPRVEYSLTEDGAKLRDAILPLLKWAASRTTQKECPMLKVQEPL